jgi:N-acetylmuramoyl-L-alanine amidase
MQNNSNIYIFVRETGNFMKKAFLYFLSVFFILLINSSISTGMPNNFPNKDETHVSVVVIDPGHGGKDPGAVVGNAREKDIVLDIGLKLGQLIKTKFPETKVIYTRNKDVFIPLYQRADIANKNKADLFISIHANYVGSRSVQGTETFVLGQYRSEDNLEVAKKENSVILLEDDYKTTYEGFDPNSPESYIMFELVQDEYLEQSVMLASVIQDEFRKKAKRIDRSVKQAGFLVLRETTMPSVLVEAGFLSHPSEGNYLLSESGRSNIASAIFSAFQNYKKKIEEKSSFNIVTGEVGNPADLRTGLEKNSDKQQSLFFSVQLVATTQPIDTEPSNFKGETNIFKIDSENTYRYYSGKYRTYKKALEEKQRLMTKFEGAFVVAFENDKLISVKKALGKM